MRAAAKLIDMETIFFSILVYEISDIIYFFKT